MNTKGRVPETHGLGMEAEDSGGLDIEVEHDDWRGAGLEVTDVIPSGQKVHIQLIHADCTGWLPAKNHFDLILTDPPPFEGYRHLLNACRRLYMVTGEDLVDRGDTTVPGRKRIAPYMNVLRSMHPRPKLVVDPYMGSGSIGIAAYNCGMDYIGVERSVKRFAYALERLVRFCPGAEIESSKG